MKISAISDMFYGRRGQLDQLPVTEEYRKQFNEFFVYQKELEEKLKQNPDLLQLYKQVLNSYDEVVCIQVEDYYAEGFRYGVLIGLDVAIGLQKDE